MKTRHCFCLLTIFFVFFVVIFAADTCPAGMRKTYIDDINTIAYGSGYSPYGAICFYDDPGSLFLNRRILIEPRFEVHLKTTINPVPIIENAREQRLYGFTIVISGSSTNTISGILKHDYKSDSKGYDDIGYNNFVNSLIVEFDFFKDKNDPDSSSYSIRYCSKSCNSNDKDKIVLKSNRLNSQRYELDKQMNWDFTLIYDNQVLRLVQGQTELYKANYNLVNVLGTNVATVGFTGFLEGNNRELSLIGTFVCEDNYEMPKMLGYFYVNSKSYRKTTYNPGSSISFKFSFINNRGQTIPHTYGYNIWNYSFSVTSDCGITANSLQKLGSSNYDLLLNTKACTKAGRHAIYLSEKLKGKGPAIYYTVNAGALKRINLVGHDGKIAAVPSKKISNYLLLTYGTSPSGNFIMKKNAVLVLDFDFLDEYGNSVTVKSPANYFSFRRIYDNGDIFPVTNQFLTYQVNQKNGRYQMVITVTQMATYQIEKNSYMSKAIRFIVVPGEVSPTLSYCTLNGSPAIEVGSRLFVADCTGGIEQKWKYNADGSLTNFAGDLCAEIAGCATNDLQIIINKCHIGDTRVCAQSKNQEWDFNSDGTIVTRMSTKKCLQVNGNIVQTHVCNNGANQKFVYSKKNSTIINGNKCFSPFDFLDISLKTITSPPTLLLGENIYYMCYFKDDYGNDITTKYFSENSIYEFVCENQRLLPTSKTYKTEYTDKATYSVSKYVTSETGKFEINGYLVKKGTSNRIKITPKINQFTVKGTPDTYVLKNVLNLQNKNWANINGAQINYVYDKGGLITAVDLAESDGLTLISSYGKYPSDFNVSNIQAEIYNSHDNNFTFGELETSIVTLNNKQYVGIYTKGKNSSDRIIKKSSFDYSIKITYQKGSTSEQKNVTLKYILNIGSYKTCFHNLDIGKTNLNIGSSLSFVVGENERKIAIIELKTLDNYLYNYYIDKDKIQFLLEPTSSSITFRVALLSIEGTYDIYAKPISEYQGNLNIKVNGQQIKKIPIKSRQEACYLEFLNPALFTHLKTNFKEHYYEYKGGFVNGSFDFLFKILDRNKKVIVKNDYFATYADIYSEQYGNDKTKFTVYYNQKSAAFEFKDNLPYVNQKLTWVFFMKDSTCNNKYYIKYDGLKGGAPLDLSKSSYSLLNTKINIKEYAYVHVIYRDTVNLYYGLQKGKLEEMKKTTVVKGKRTDGKEVTFAFDSITKDYAIRYKYNFDLSGTYTVTATSGGKALKCSTSNSLEVIDNIYSLKHSKLKMILDTIIDMDPNVRATIDNTIHRPVYKLYFYSATGVKTTYTKDSVFTCKMTGTKVSLDLKVEKKTDHIQFTYQDKDIETFKNLVKGNYQLIIADKTSNIQYPLFLKGDGSSDASNDPNYDLSKTVVNPTTISGVVGKTYQITVELRAEDGLRWNKLVDTTKFSITNSRNLKSNSFTYKVEKGYKKGQAIISVTQKEASTNVLTLSYNGKQIPKTVTLKMSCGNLAGLKYISGPTQGNVINPPILTFQPVDSFGNIYTPLFTTAQTAKYLNSLTIGTSLDKATLTSNNYLDKNKNYLLVQYKSTISNNVRVTSTYFKEHYDYRIKSGPIDPTTSYAELLNVGTKEVKADYNLMIYPKDKYNNDIDDLNKNDMNKFSTYYQLSQNKYNVSPCSLKTENVYKTIVCSTSITKTGSMEFNVEYIKNKILCKNCKFSVTSNTPVFTNTKTYYTNRKIYLNVKEDNKVEAKNNPTFELTFFDNFNNQMDEAVVQKLNVEVSFEGIDIKLCVSNSKNKKLVNLCPVSNGDDNLNKWQYLVNGKYINLIIQDKNNKTNKLIYSIVITGGAVDGSSDYADLSKTYFQPTTIVVEAGVEGKTIMEIRTKNNTRKNYWYPNPSEKIKVEFEKDKNTCSYKIEKGGLPGQYAIKIVCTKTTDSNSFIVTIESTKLTGKKINVKITSGRAYYLEVENISMFKVSGDKYTWKNNPTNDDHIIFNFKLKDKYQNYITTSVLKNNEITVTAEKYGKNYELKFIDKNKDYLFNDTIDKIGVYVPSQVWNIICVESKRQYSFIYSKVAGEPNYNKSYWTIDKKQYVIKESSTVLIYLIDKYGVNVGTISGKLANLNKNVQVSVVDKSNKISKYNYNSITKENGLKYLYNYDKAGEYEVKVTYGNKLIKQKVSITVIYEKVSLKSSKLYCDLGDKIEVLMFPQNKAQINNMHEYPSYKFYLYTANGKAITNYDHNLNTKCKMTYGSSVWELKVFKNDTYLHLTYVGSFDNFKKIPFGDYKLEITFDKETVSYPLHLLGEKNFSPKSNYDLTKTFVKPTLIDGEAGKQYTVDIEFRASDNLRWNYDIIPGLFEVTNSDKLNSNKLKIKKQKGEKNGQIKLLITQYTTTKRGKDNILSMTYKSANITQTITLHIKCAELTLLEYYSGAVDGTVVNPSIVKFIPKDLYGNLYTDLFDAKFPKKELEKLTTGVSVEKYPLTINNFVSDEEYLNVQYGCKKVTTIKVTSKYIPKTYQYKLWSGPMAPETSFAQVEITKNVIAGQITTINIYPKDIYGNGVIKLTKSDLDKLNVVYEVNKNNKVTISKTCSIVKDNTFKCKDSIIKAGEVQLTVEYTKKDVSCTNCKFNINPDKLDFSKTKVYNKNGNNEMSNAKLNTLTSATTPNFELFFFDKYNNAITSKTDVSALPVTTEFVDTDVKLCVTNNGLTKLSTVCKSTNNDENQEKWKYLTNGDKYKLIVNGSKNDKSLMFPVKITGGFSDGDSAPINPSKTLLNPTIISLIAGEKGTITLELRTKEDKRKNYWFTAPEKHISVKFPNDVKNCKYSLEKSQKPGQYSIIFTCTEKKDAFKVTVLVENTEVPKKITITVNPNVPASSKLFRMTGEEIKQFYLGSVSVEDKFQMKNKLYDKFNNLITNVKIYLTSLQIQIKPTNNVLSHKFSAETIEDKDGFIIITLKSTYAGEHTVVGAYFPLPEYKIIFTHGVLDADNSLLEVSHTERFAGEDVKIYITPYDKYNNYIDASEFKQKNPFQTKYKNEGSNNELLMGKYIIEKVQGKNVLSYPGVFYVKGIASIFGYIGKKGIKCVTCRINIKSKDVYFPNSDVLRFESSKKDFENFKNGTKEKNVEEEPVYRLYPRDQYKNTVDIIPQATLLTYKAYFASQKESTVYYLKLNNKETVNQNYAEFVINDIKGAQVSYKTLVGGYYDLVFTNGKNKLVYNITLLGDGKGGSNEDADIQQTAIIEQNLKYIAGNTGYMIIEIRTKKNIRKNYWDAFNIRVESCDAKDKTFNYIQERAGLLGVFLVTVTTKKANIYPKLTKCPLKIYVNNQLVKKLSPEQEVSYDEVVRTKIVEKYYKDGKSSAILKDGTADKDYEFEVASYDKYNNLQETLQEVIGITVKYEGKEEINESTSETDISTGYRKYIVTAIISGTYAINTEKSGSQGLYLLKESTFKINPGVIDLSKTVVKERETPIKAGNKPSISIEAYDKYGNALYSDDYINKFISIFTDANSKSHTSKGQYENDIEKVFYTSEIPVTIVGDVNVEVTYDKKDKIDTSNVFIEVIPGDPYATNSILSRETSEGVYTKYKNGDSFEIDTKELLLLNVTLFDKYNNLITEIPADSEILKPLMSGNYMEEIKFSMIQNTEYFNLDFNDHLDYIHIYKHLVGGTYDLTYIVKTSLGQASFKYNMVIRGGDGKHGNGPYAIEKCVLTPKKISFMAGTYGELYLELRNGQGLLYNDDINITSDISIQNVEEDSSFVSSIEKADPDYYGVYTIKIYSEKKGDRNIYALLTDITSKGRTKKRVGPGLYNVYPEKVPDRQFTVITNPPEPKINYDSIIEMSFILADRFNNSFEGRHDIVDDKYLTLLNNEEPLPYASLSLLPDKQTYKLSVYPKYPPKNMTMNILYNDGENTVYCFLNNTIVTILVGIDYSLTQIVSSNKENIKVGEVLDMSLYTFDKKGECIDDQDYSQDYEIKVTGPMDSTKQFTKKYSVKNIVNKKLECNNKYQIITTDDDIYKYSGNYIIKVYGNSYLIARYDEVCSPLGYSLNGFLLDYTFDPNKISILDKVSFTVTGTDMYGNKVTDPLIDDLEIYFTKDESKTIFESQKSEFTSGTVDFKEVSIHVVGHHQLHMTYKGKEVLTVNNGEKLPIFIFLVGPCHSENNDNFDLSPLDDITTNTKTYFSFQCYDIYNNKIIQGGEKFTVISHRYQNGILIDVDADVEDNSDGTYTVKFVPELEGMYIFNILVGTEKYGQEIQKELKNRVCEGEYSKSCPNKKKCVKDLIDCVEPADKCKEDKTKPFWCLVNGEYTCTKSQIDCDCPKGYIRCKIQKYCVPEGRSDMCATFKILNNYCKIYYGIKYKMFDDGYCRLKEYRMPNQRVCPIGQVLCADLSCRDSYDDCMVSEVRDRTDIRCVGQQLVTNIKYCPSTITCEKETDVVCPDGTCVENEIYCPALTKCNDDKLPYLCQNNNCAADFNSCSTGITCGHKDSLCADGICREKC